MCQTCFKSIRYRIAKICLIELRDTLEKRDIFKVLETLHSQWGITESFTKLFEWKLYKKLY